MIRWGLAVVLALAALAGPAHAQTAKPVAACGTPGPSGGYPLGTPQALTQTQGGALCISGSISATTTLNAVAALPTLAPGSQSLQGSLAGALYVQEAFGTASGGGTQVDATHGLPVDVKQLSGNTIDTNSGNKSAGTIRTVIATDQPNLTTPLNITCSNCSGAGLSQTDASTFTPGAANAFANAGGFFQTTATNNALTNLQQGAFQLTANRALFVNLRNASGAELAVAAAPLQVSLANTAANATAVKVDNSAVTQPVNVATLNGTAIDTNSGNKSAGTQRVVIATDQPNLTTPLNVSAAQSGTWTVQPGNTANTTAWQVEQGCAGQSVANTTVTSFSLTASTQILAGVSAKKYYICAIDIAVAGANNVALVEGTGSVCATGIAGMSGGTTAATGWNFAANSGLTLGNGQGVVKKTATNADNVCLLLSAGTQVSGTVTTANF